MLITLGGSHVSSRVCARSFAVLGTVGQSLPLHASVVGCAHSGPTVGLRSDLYFVVQVSIFLHTVDGLQASARFSAVGCVRVGKIPGARSTADGQATCQVASTRAVISDNKSTKVCGNRWRMILNRWILLARRVVLGITSVRWGRTPKQQCEDPLLRTCAEVVNLRQN